MRDQMIIMRAQGRTYREIGEVFGVSTGQAWQILNRRKPKPDHARLWSIDNAPELKTWLAVRGELHVHHESERDGQSRWMLVERKTAKCQSHRCMKVGTR